MNNVLLNARNIYKNYRLGNQTIEVLKGIDLKIHKGEFISIMGKSGSGKSTLLSILAGLESPDQGSVFLNESDITQLTEEKLALKRQTDIGFIFQSFHLLPTLTVAENISFPLEISQQKNVKKRTEELLESVSMSHRKNNFPHQLSGGERQRTAIARALIIQPQILFADEPTGNLDEKSAEDVLDLLLALQKRSKTALVVVTHEKDIAQKADNVIHIQAGKINQ